MKKISILTLSLNSGGAEKVISLLLPELVKEYEVYLVLFKKEIHFDIPANVHVIELDFKGFPPFLNKIISFPVFFFKYGNMLKKNKIRTSVSFLTRPNLLNSLQKWMNPSLQVIISERCFPSIAYRSSSMRYLLYKLLIPFAYNKADFLFSNSLYINKDLLDNFQVKIPSSVIYNPVSFVIEKQQKMQNETFRLINVGKIYPIKNQTLIVNALTDLEIPFHMSFVGGGTHKENLQVLITENNLTSKCTFTGNVKDVNLYLKNNDCFILSSNSEGFPNVILEAMACGLPIISTNCISGPLELLNDNEEVTIQAGQFFRAKYGILINVDDAEALRNAILHLYNNPKIYEELSARSSQRVQHYSVSKIYNQFSNLIHE